MRETAHDERRSQGEAEARVAAAHEGGSCRAAPGGREAHILGLQRTVGNQAVARLLADGRKPPSEASVQRRTIAQDNVLAGATGLTQQGSRTLIGAQAWPVDVYTPDAVATAATKLEALNLAGQLSGTAANTVTAHYKNLYNALDAKQKKAFSPNKPWTNVPAKLNTADHPQIDPFFLDVTVNYQAGEAPHQMTLSFQHADRLSGYVTTVRDTGNPATAAGVSLVDQPHAAPEPVSPPANLGMGAETGANPVPAQAGANVVDTASTKYTKYGTSHEEAGSENILELTSGAGEKNLDAYTKLAGEGSRWEAVRRHAAFLKNTSRFFVTAPRDATKVRAIEFKLLWKTWNSRFDKQYNIPDARLGEYLLTEHPNYIFELDKSAMGDDDYDVAAGRPYRETRTAAQPTTG